MFYTPTSGVAILNICLRLSLDIFRNSIYLNKKKSEKVIAALNLIGSKNQNTTMDTALNFTNRNEWRDWLDQNHDKKDHVWLLYHKKTSIKRGICLGESVEEAICFGWIDGKLKKINEEKFAVRFSPRQPKSVWSKINKEKAEKLLKLGRMTSAGIATIEKAKASGSWENAYTNKVKDAVPNDLEKALRNNEKAWSNFQNFANSYRNMYIGWVIGAKTERTRKQRIGKVIEQSLLNKKLFGAE